MGVQPLVGKGVQSFVRGRVQPVKGFTSGMLGALGVSLLCTSSAFLSNRKDSILARNFSG